MAIRITFVIPSLSAGGAERVMSTVANYFAKQGYSVTLLTLDWGRKPFFKIDETITQRSLGLLSVSNNIFQTVIRSLRRSYRLRREIKRSNPDVVVSFMDKTNVLTLFSLFGSKIPVIVSEHMDSKQGRRMLILLRRIAYRWASRVVVLTKSMKKYFTNWLASEQVVIIPNPIRLEDERSNISNQVKLPKGKLIVAIGRLVRQKGFDLLIESFAKVSSNNLDWNLVILGQGQMQGELERLIGSLNLKNRIFLLGLVPNPLAILKQADIFAMSSRFEGFPMVILEAMAQGVAVVSFDCPCGPSEIIRDKIDGVLVPPENVAALATTIAKLMRDENERKRLALRAPEVLERFGSSRILEMWRRVVDEVYQSGANSKKP
ncbi:MAG: glycosyltransferase family 4 protein [Candidatus Omnitrophica bacterium]|nr:glycosyltransferase family 4 protein [Candidatus Omnitrophota bacterium]